GDVLAETVALRIVDHRHEVLGEVAEGGFVAGLAEEVIGRFAVESRESAHHVPDVGTDAEVPPLPGVDRDPQKSIPRSSSDLATVTWPSPPPVEKTARGKPKN